MNKEDFEIDLMEAQTKFYKRASWVLGYVIFCITIGIVFSLLFLALNAGIIVGGLNG